MRRFLLGAGVLALFLGIVGGVVMTSQHDALSAYCDTSGGSFVYYKETGLCPDEGGKGKNATDMIGKYICEGFYPYTTTPCNCTFVGCVVDPYSQPGDPNIP